MKPVKLVVTLTLMSVLAACSSTSPEEKLAKQEARSELLNSRVSSSQALVSKLEERLTQANSEDLKYFAPDELKKANEEYKDAKEDLDEIVVDKTEATKSHVGDISEAVFDANTALDAAYVIKKNAELILVDSFDIRNQLLSLNANTIKQFARSYKSLSDDIDDIVEDIADGDLEDARSDNAKLLPKLRGLEISVVKYIELDNAERQLAALKKARANRYAPNAHQQALSAVRIAESTIAADPRATDKIKEAVAAADFELAHTRHMLQAVQELSKVKSSMREGYVTRFETQLLKISQVLGDADFRNLAIAEQAKKITELAAVQKQKLEQLKTSAASSNEEASQLVAAAQSQVAELEQTIANKDNQVQSQVEANTVLTTKISALETANLESQKKALILEKEKLELEAKIQSLSAGKPEQAQPQQQPIEQAQEPVQTEAPVQTEQTAEEEKQENPPA